MRNSVLPMLKTLDLFNSMKIENFETLMQTAYFQIFPSQVELVTEGDSADFLHIVVEGSVELFARSNNRETTMSMVYPIGMFILAAVLKDAVYLMSARTHEKSKILMIPSENVRTAFESDKAFSHSVISELASGYRNLIKAQKELKLRTAVERLANVLLRYNEKQNRDGNITLDIEKRILASLLGMTPENLSRAFNTLKPYGVKVNGENISLTDLKSLRTLAKPNHLIDVLDT